MNLSVAFRLTRRDGAIIDERGPVDPLEFVCGEGLVFAGLDKGVLGMAVGETRILDLVPEDAFGARDEERKVEVPSVGLPPDSGVGMQLKVSGPDGDDIWATIERLDGDQAVLDLNHPLAGVSLTMSVTLLKCEPVAEMEPFVVETTSPGDDKTYPTKGDRVTIHYGGALASGGAAFMSTRDAGEPVKFRVGFGQVIRGLDEGVMVMSLGERATMRVPAVMAYGDVGIDGVIPPNADLMLDVELLEID